MGYMKTLYYEIEDELAKHGKTFDDVLWIGTKDTEIQITNPKKQLDITYCPGYGAPEINPWLLVVGKDWWMERHEYDGSEWFEFKTYPNRPPKKTEDTELILNFDRWLIYSDQD